VIGDVGVKLKAAVGGGDVSDATDFVGAEMAEAEPPSLLAVTTTRIMCPVSVDVSV
jgi:hypothetical protein